MFDNKVMTIGLTLVVMSTLLMIGLYVNSEITPVALNAIDYTTTTTTNESIFVSNVSAATYELDNAGVAEWRASNELSCVEVRNVTDHALTATTHYTCNNSGVLILAAAVPTVNNSAYNVTYSYGLDSSTHTEIRNVRSTFLSSMSLAVIVLIVLSASGVIFVIFTIGKGRS